MEEATLDNTLVNSKIWKVTTTLVDILDAIAVYCDSRASYDDLVETPIGFVNYPFPQPSIQSFMPMLRSRILKRTYGGQNLFQVANGLKHDCPYLGNVTCNVSKNEVRDVWKDSVGFVHHVLTPTYNDMVEIIEQLNMQLDDKIDMDLATL